MTPLRVLAALTAVAWSAAPLDAQGTWDAILAVDPVPSPYLSDWEANPNYGTLTVFNGSGQTQSVRLVFSVVDMRGGVLASGRSEPQVVLADGPAIFDDPFEIAGSTTHDTEVEDQMRRTGRLPEGDYRACVAVVDLGGFQLAEACESFSVVYPDPPLLVAPFAGEVVRTQDLFFQWTPSQVPFDFGLRYVLAIAEVRQGQLPAEALRSNILHFHDPDVASTQLQYPLDAQPLEPGTRYAWRVQALDINGYPVAANDGSSEIWTFVYRGSGDDVVVSAIALASRRDTLRRAGDTVRLAATAYDQYDLEMVDQRFQWSAADTTIARVDSTGLVTWVGAGETRIVASVDDVADSALVTAMPGGMTVRFAQYDAETEQPTLLELVQSGSYDDVVPRLMEMLETGEFVIPIPRLPALERDESAGGGEPEDGSDVSHGPSADAPTGWAGAARGRRLDRCEGLAVSGFSVVKDDAKRVFVLSFPSATALGGCVPLTDDQGETVGERVDTTAHASALFAVSWKHPGLPRAFLALKGIGQLPLPIAGTEVKLRYLVLAFPRPVSLDSTVLPAEFAGFFGAESFEAGVGLTYYAKRRCPASTTTRLCNLLSWINDDDPDITIQAFAGVTASEASLGYGTGGLAVGVSAALGFSIQASLPVKIYDLDPLGVSLDSTQVGLLFSVQDSIVADTDTAVSGHNWSIGLSPTLTVWWSTDRNGWELTGSIGIEVDPTKLGDRPKFVFSAALPAVWKLWYLRLGNPQVVFTKVLEAGGTAELALSGTWGVGSWDGNPVNAVGLEDGEGGGHRGDAGGGSIGGVAGFEELGRGAVILKWTRSTPDTTAIPRAPTDASRALDALNEATVHMNTLERLERQAKTNCDASGDPDSEACQFHPSYLAQLADAEMDYKQARDAYFAIRRSQVGGTPGPVQGPHLPTCKGTLVSNRSRCFSWSARLSMGSGGLLDLLAVAIRAGTGTQ